MMFSISRAVFLIPLFACLLVFSVKGFPPKAAILTPDGTVTSGKYAKILSELLESRIEVIDRDLAEAVLSAGEIESPYNMTNLESRNIGTGIGCDFLVLLKSDTLRRSSLERPKYFESYSAVYLVDARSGDLVDWNMHSAKADTAEESLSELMKTANETSGRITAAIVEESRKPARAAPNADEELAADKNARFPLPYRRLKPEYTRSANLYGIAATVDILVEIDKSGAVTGTRIMRWAGFGLDESVEATVRKMNWRPADNKDGSFTMRVLLRYNFRDIADDSK